MTTTAKQVASLTQTKSMNAVAKKKTNSTNKLVKHKQQQQKRRQDQVSIANKKYLLGIRRQ